MGEETEMDREINKKNVVDLITWTDFTESTGVEIDQQKCLLTDKNWPVLGLHWLIFKYCPKWSPLAGIQKFPSPLEN